MELFATMGTREVVEKDLAMKGIDNCKFYNSLADFNIA